jgi:hypothetical protein
VASFVAAQPAATTATAANAIAVWKFNNELLKAPPTK